MGMNLVRLVHCAKFKRKKSMCSTDRMKRLPGFAITGKEIKTTTFSTPNCMQVTLMKAKGRKHKSTTISYYPIKFKGKKAPLPL